jgi:septum site-determining protein MinD
MKKSLVIGILSGKGGVGKTTIVTNLGAVLAKEYGKRVILVDGNVFSSHLGLYLNLYEDFKVTLRDVLNRRAPIQQAIYIHPDTGLRILPAPLEGGKINLRKIGSVIRKLSRDYDITIIDTAPGLGKEVLTIASNLDAGFVVTTPDLPSVTDALKTIKILERTKTHVLGVILNRVTQEKYELSKNEIESICRYPCCSLVPEDKNIPKSIARGIPLVIDRPSSMASIEIKKLAAALIGVEYRPQSLIYSLKKMFGLIKEEETEINFFVRKPKLEIEKRGRKSKKEIIDIEKLRRNIRKEIKEMLKKELAKRLREKIKESGI